MMNLNIIKSKSNAYGFSIFSPDGFEIKQIRQALFYKDLPR